MGCPPDHLRAPHCELQRCRQEQGQTVFCVLDAQSRKCLAVERTRRYFGSGPCCMCQLNCITYSPVRKGSSLPSSSARQSCHRGSREGCRGSCSPRDLLASSRSSRQQCSVSLLYTTNDNGCTHPARIAEQVDLKQTDAFCVSLTARAREQTSSRNHRLTSGAQKLRAPSGFGCAAPP